MAPKAQQGRIIPRAYPIVLKVDYKLPHGAMSGHGWTASLSSKIVEFIAAEPLPLHSQINLSIAWPALLNEKVALRLCIQGQVIKSGDNCVLVQMQRYEFRTKASSSSALSPRRGINSVTLCPTKEEATAC